MKRHFLLYMLYKFSISSCSQQGLSPQIDLGQGAGTLGGGREAVALAVGREPAPTLLQMQQMSFFSSFCKGELQASGSKVLQIHLFCEVSGLSSFKILRQYLVGKVIPTRKICFYFKTTLLSQSILQRHYSYFHCLSKGLCSYRSY